MKKFTPILSVLIFISALFAVSANKIHRPSIREFISRAENGDPEAMYRLSALLETGFDTIPADTTRSLGFLKSSALAGYAPAQNYLGFLYGSGTILEQNPDSAAYWMVRAHNAGLPLASHNIAFVILNGDTIVAKKILTNLGAASSQADSIAIDFLSRASDAGLPGATTMLADLYAQGNILPKDTSLAISLYEKAIASKFPDASIRLINMMTPVWNLYNSQTSMKEAIRYWNMGAPEIAVSLLRNIGPGDAQTSRAYALLGIAASRGYGMSYNHDLSVEYFARAAMMGQPSAAFILAETLEIFPDALNKLFPELPESMTPESLRAQAKRADIDTPEKAIQALLSQSQKPKKQP